MVLYSRHLHLKLKISRPALKPVSRSCEYREHIFEQYFLQILSTEASPNESWWYGNSSLAYNIWYVYVDQDTYCIILWHI